MEEESTLDQLLKVVNGLAGSAADILKATQTPATIPPAQNKPATQAGKDGFLDSLKDNPALLFGGLAAVVAVIFFATRR